MQRLFVETALAEGARIDCDAPQANYLRNVLRLKSDAEIAVFNGRDGEWRARLEVPAKRKCHLIIKERLRAQDGGPDVLYLFAPLKMARQDYMVQKATELGVAAMQPVMTERTNVSRINYERMRANVIEAAMQCGVLRMPEVHEAAPLRKAIAALSGDRRLIFCDEASPHANPVEALGALGRDAPAAVLIGPEGGFSPDERNWLLARENVTAVSLGPRIMRADTAAVAALALVNAVIGDWN